MYVVASSLSRSELVVELALAAPIGALAVVGALLVDRAPATRIGQSMLSAAALIVLGTALDAYASLGATANPVPWPGTAVAAQLSSLPAQYALVIVLIGIPLIFPTGSLISARWRWIAWLTVAAMAANTVYTISDTTTGSSLGWLAFLSAITAPIGFGGATAAVVVRYRRGSTTERQQLKWLVATAGFAAVVFPIAFLLPPGPLADGALFLGLAALFGLPVAIGVAVLRYRLYEIDRIVSRTISYAAISLILVAVYAAIVLALQTLLGEVIGKSPVAVAGTTLVVASLFQPVRRRVQGAVDRRFDRRQYDAERTIAAFSERLRDQVDLESLRTDIDTAIHATLAPATSGIWLRRRADVHPPS